MLHWSIRGSEAGRRVVQRWRRLLHLCGYNGAGQPNLLVHSIGLLANTVLPAVWLSLVDRLVIEPSADVTAKA